LFVSEGRADLLGVVLGTKVDVRLAVDGRRRLLGPARTEREPRVVGDRLDEDVVDVW